jgi:hypothetical protein
VHAVAPTVALNLPATQLLLKGEGGKRVKGHLKLYGRHVRQTHSSQRSGFKSEFEYEPAAHRQEQRRMAPELEVVQSPPLPVW